MFVVCCFNFSFVHFFVSTEKNTISGNQKFDKPPLQRYIQGWNITRNVNWLLHFAIVGFPKTGTSTLMFYLRNHSQSIFMFPDERCELAWNQHVPLLKDIYKEYQPNLQMGIKCPTNLEVDLALKNYKKFFPATKFIVGLRHPVRWFESFYNFRITNGFYDIPPAEKLIGKCRRRFKGVCTFRANFSHHLQKIEPFRKVFLYDVGQLRDDDYSRSSLFLRDFGAFLGLSQSLEEPMIWVKPGKHPTSTEEKEMISSRQIDICEDKYYELRRVLMQQASFSASWILEKFVKNPKVTVSSGAYFSQILEKWHSDPCEDCHK